MHMRQTYQIISYHSINQARAYNRSNYRYKSARTTTIYMGEYYYSCGGHLEILIGGRLHDIRSSFIFIIIITIVGVGVGVVDDDVVLGMVVISSWRRVSHEYS